VACLAAAPSPQKTVYEAREGKHHEQRGVDGVELAFLRVDVSELAFQQQRDAAD